MADRSSGEDVFSDPWKGTRRAGGEDSATDAEDEEEDEPDLPEGDDVMGKHFPLVSHSDRILNPTLDHRPRTHRRS